MTLRVFDMPETPADLAHWLDRALVDRALSALVSELEVIHRGHGDQPPPTLDSLLGEHRDAILRSGLSELPLDRIPILLRNPRLLLELQDEVLSSGQSYWNDLLSEDETLARGVDQVWSKLESSISGGVSTSEGSPGNPIVSIPFTVAFSEPLHTPEMPDEPLTLGFREHGRDRNDEESWNKLADQWIPLIRGWVEVEVKDRDDVDELVQEVLGSLLQKLLEAPSLVDRDALDKWLVTETKFRIQDFQRRQWAAKRSAPGEAALQALGDLEISSHPVGSTQSQKFRECLAKVQLEVSPMTWRVFEARFLEGRSSTEIAQQFGLRIRSVHRMMHSILLTIRERMKEPSD